MEKGELTDEGDTQTAQQGHLGGTGAQQVAMLGRGVPWRTPVVTAQAGGGGPGQGTGLQVGWGVEMGGGRKEKTSFGVSTMLGRRAEHRQSREQDGDTDAVPQGSAQ